MSDDVGTRQGSDMLFARAAAAQAEARVLREQSEALRAERRALQVKVEQLEAGLRTRGTIGQAQGILMERHKITADEAFAMLRVRSQNLNVKLARLAEHLASTGELL